MTTARIVQLVKAFMSLVRVHRTLRARNLSGLAICLGPRTARARSGSDSDIAQMVAAVDTACSVYVRPSTCLHRSAALVRLLRGYRIDAELVLGVRTQPYGGHAWVEVADAIVNDDPSVRLDYRPIRRV